MSSAVIPSLKDPNIRKIYEETYNHKQPTLVLKQSERTLDNNVLEDGTRGDVNGGAF
jgi:hypothetical protein